MSMSVGGVTRPGYIYPIDPYDEDLNVELAKTDIKVKPNFVDDKKMVTPTNRELNPTFDSLRPILKSPEEVSMSEIKRVMGKIERINSKIDRWQLDVQLLQRELREMDSTRAGERMLQLQKEGKAYKDEINETWQAFYDLKKHSKIASWIDTVTTMAFLVVSVVSAALAIATAGLSLGITAGLLAAVGVAKGGTQIASGVLKYKAQESQALLMEIQFKRDVNLDDLSRVVGDLKAGASLLKLVYNLTHEFLKNYHKVSLMK